MPTPFCYGSISHGFSAAESRKYLYNAIDKSDISNMHKYLLTKNNIK